MLSSQPTAATSSAIHVASKPASGRCRLLPHILAHFDILSLLPSERRMQLDRPAALVKAGRGGACRASAFSARAAATPHRSRTQSFICAAAARGCIRRFWGYYRRYSAIWGLICYCPPIAYPATMHETPVLIARAERRKPASLRRRSLFCFRFF